MGISNELKQRLRDIELEQKRQELALKKFDDFEEKIRELEAQLKQIDNFEIKLQQQIDYNQLRNLNETQRIEAELQRMDKEYHARDFNELRYFEEIAQLRAKLTGEITSLKAMKENLLGDQEEDTIQKPNLPIPPKTVVNPPTTVENSQEIKRLNVQLAKTDYKVESSLEERYFAEIQQLKNGLSGENKPSTTTRPPPTAKSTETRNKVPSPAVQPKQKAVSQSGYVICLMLNPNAPTEWSGELESGGGWREPGKGTCYSDVEQVKRCLRGLKKQWPHYPLKVIKRFR